MLKRIVILSAFVFSGFWVEGRSTESVPDACRPATRFANAPWWTARLAETRSRILEELCPVLDRMLGRCSGNSVR